MKWNFGTGVVIAFLVFAAGILLMVSISMNRELDLVSDDYYQQELKHQDRIESTRRANALPEQPAVRLSNSLVTVKLPKRFASGGTAGILTFYRPADRKSDFTIPLQLDSTGTQQVQASSLLKGLWRVKVRWTSQHQDYYHEEPIMVQ